MSTDANYAAELRQMDEISQITTRIFNEYDPTKDLGYMPINDNLRQLKEYSEIVTRFSQVSGLSPGLCENLSRLSDLITNTEDRLQQRRFDSAVCTDEELFPLSNRVLDIFGKIFDSNTSRAYLSAQLAPLDALREAIEPMITTELVLLARTPENIYLPIQGSTTADAMRHDAYNRWWRRDMLSGRVTTCADSVVSQLATAWLKDLSKISQACQTYEKNEAGLSFEGYLRELASCQHELTTCVKSAAVSVKGKGLAISVLDSVAECKQDVEDAQLQHSVAYDDELQAACKAVRDARYVLRDDESSSARLAEAQEVLRSHSDTLATRVGQYEQISEQRDLDANAKSDNELTGRVLTRANETMTSLSANSHERLTRGRFKTRSSRISSGTSVL